MRMLSDRRIALVGLFLVACFVAPEGIHAKSYFTSPTGTGTGGFSDPANLAWAVGDAAAGDTIYLFPGDYGNVTLVIDKQLHLFGMIQGGNPPRPSSAIDYEANVSSYDSLWPTLSGATDADRETGIAIDITSTADGTTVKNIHIQRYLSGIKVVGAYNCVIDNLVMAYFGYSAKYDDPATSIIETYQGRGFNIYQSNGTNVSNVFLMDCEAEGFRIVGDSVTLDSCTTYNWGFYAADGFPMNNWDSYNVWSGMDYPFIISATTSEDYTSSGNVIKNCKAYTNTATIGQAVGNWPDGKIRNERTFQLTTGNNSSLHVTGNTLQNCYSHEGNSSHFSILGENCDGNTFIGCTTNKGGYAFYLLNGPDNNIFRKCYTHNTTTGVKIYHAWNRTGDVSGNKWINCMFGLSWWGINLTNSGSSFTNNEFVNCTFAGRKTSPSNYGFYLAAVKGTDITTSTSNLFRNCIIYGARKYKYYNPATGYTTGVFSATFDYCNIDGNFDNTEFLQHLDADADRTNTVLGDPSFVDDIYPSTSTDLSDANYYIANGSAAVNSGSSLVQGTHGVVDDIVGVARGPYYDIGAYENTAGN